MRKKNRAGSHREGRMQGSSPREHVVDEVGGGGRRAQHGKATERATGRRRGRSRWVGLGDERWHMGGEAGGNTNGRWQHRRDWNGKRYPFCHSFLFCPSISPLLPSVVVPTPVATTSRSYFQFFIDEKENSSRCCMERRTILVLLWKQEQFSLL
jgi:hypothetical protein